MPPPVTPEAAPVAVPPPVAAPSGPTVPAASPGTNIGKEYDGQNMEY
jgi:hypothetical protein